MAENLHELVLKVHDGRVWRLRKDCKQDQSTFHEIIVQDGYRVKWMLGEDFTPSLIFDAGTTYGDFAGLCRDAWPHAKIVGMDMEPLFEPVWRGNIGDHNCKFYSGYLTNDSPLVSKYIATPDQVARHVVDGRIKFPLVLIEDIIDAEGVPQLLKIDIEGGEVDVLIGLHNKGCLQDIDWIVGEWHWPPALAKIIQLLQDTHDVQWDGEWPVCQCHQFWARRRSQ